MKQICSISLHCETYTSAPLLAFVRQVLHRYPTAAQMLENEHDIVTSGTYTPNAEDPEHTNPLATSAWELGTLKFHVNPSVKVQAAGAGAHKMLMLPSEDPIKIRTELVRDSKECHIPMRVIRKKHPLYQRKDKKRNRQQYRFITPRETMEHHLK